MKSGEEEFEAFFAPDPPVSWWEIAKTAAMRLAVLALCVLFWLAVWYGVARAEMQLVMGVFCDQQDQITEVVLAKDTPLAVQLVNQSVGDDNACGLARFATDTQEVVETITKDGNPVEIVKIHAVGQIIGPGMVVPVDLIQYGARPAAGQGT